MEITTCSYTPPIGQHGRLRASRQAAAVIPFRPLSVGQSANAGEPKIWLGRAGMPTRLDARQHPVHVVVVDLD